MLLLTPFILTRIMAPSNSVSFSDPAYAIYSAWPKKTRSRRVSETLEDHKRCLDRSRELEGLKQDVRNLSDALIELGYARRVAEVLGLEQ